MGQLFIHSGYSISPQGCFEEIAWEKLEKKTRGFAPIEPDYKTMIPAMALRRMSRITRMALFCANKNLASQALPPEGIIVASGLGNLADTEKFLDEITSERSGPLPPTAFTQSSHNTLSGQIALTSGNHGYNMTHVQRYLSFEQVIADAELQAEMGMKSILVGAADEHPVLLDELALGAGYTPEMIQKLGEGAAFFYLSQEPSEVILKGNRVVLQVEDVELAVQNFLLESEIAPNSCCILAFGRVHFPFAKKVEHLEEYVGNYLGKSAFGLHLAYSLILQKQFSSVVVCNYTPEGDLGLMVVGHA